MKIYSDLRDWNRDWMWPSILDHGRNVENAQIEIWGEVTRHTDVFLIAIRTALQNEVLPG